MKWVPLLSFGLIGICVLIGSAIWAVKKYYATEKGRWNLDKLSLKIPIIGEVLRKIAISRFARTLGTLLSSGVPILEALDICRNTAGNVVMEQALDKVRDSISEGGAIAEPLGESGIFDDLVINMIDVGEETGELDTMLYKVADTYDEEVKVLTESLMSLMEPLLIIMLGGVTVNLLLAIAIYICILSVWGEKYLPAANVKYGITVDSLGYGMGLRNGDRIVNVDGRPVESFYEIPKQIILGEARTIGVIRDGKEAVIPVPEGYISKLIQQKSPDFINVRIPFIASSFPGDSPAKAAGITAAPGCTLALW